jgi:cysteine-S-conjugate beta-lyase
VRFKARHSAGEIDALIDRLRLFSVGASWGGTASLALAVDPHAVRGTRRAAGEGPLVRLNIGLEHVDDLIADLEQAMRGLPQPEDAPHT